MLRIHIQAKDHSTPYYAGIGPGQGLLIGRAPDPSRIDWSALSGLHGDPIPSPSAAARYKIRCLTVPSGRTSANHVLVLRDATSAFLYDLGSRNGSWAKLEPHRPIMLPDQTELSLCLAGPLTQEPRLSSPPDAEWSIEDSFGESVVRALSGWLEHIDAPIRIERHNRPAIEPTELMLADDTCIRLHETDTLQVSFSTVLEIARGYIHEQNARFQQMERRASGMVVGSAILRKILSRIASAAACSRRVILLGPTGVGKELLALSYHGYSPRHAGPFVTINCALLDRELLYAQLFGARRGSFTGATSDISGLIEAADGGTLFLDELGEMNAEVQKALLRFLDSRGEYYRLGEPLPRRADVQIVCASNAALEDPSYRAARFRDDLWYRLASSVIQVPPLRERPDDIRAYLYTRMARGSKVHIAECLTRDALELVLNDPWPGNYRDLENFLDRLPDTTERQSIDRETCSKALAEGRPKSGAGAAVRTGESARAELGRGAADLHTDSVRPPSISQRSAESPARIPSKLQRGMVLPANRALGWEPVVQAALRAFLEDQAEEPAGWDQLQLFSERYLKPVFLAHASSLLQDLAPGRTLSYSALARSLHIADGGTVKTHLARFEERFPRPEGNPGPIESVLAGSERTYPR